MRRCFFATWTGWRCPEIIWKGSRQYCIFHDQSPEKDTELFERKIREKFEEKNYVFVGYHFPKDVDFRGWKFEKAVSFWRATFLGDADFSKAIFQQDAYFQEATFHRNAYFEGVSFQNAFFSKATFQDADFRGTAFRGDANFNQITFRGDANFLETTFRKGIFQQAVFWKDADFVRVTFQEEAYFSEATFARVSFSEATLNGRTNFCGATFRENANFALATFHDADFHWATFHDADFKFAVIKEHLEFIPERIEALNLRGTRFLFSGRVIIDLAKTKFHYAHLQNVAFIDCIWPENYIIYEERERINEGLSFEELETIYRNLKQNMHNHGNYRIAGEFYYREMECRKKAMREKRFSSAWFKSFGYSLLKYTCGYGEKSERTAFVSLITILMFSLLYWFTRCLEYPMKNPTILQQIGSTLYFSFVTFTTLGLGDIEPLNFWGRAFICCEAVIGAFFMALFVVVFARKMMR